MLATSRREVQSYLDGYSPRNSRQSVGVRRRDDGTIETELRQFARSEFDLVPLGTCGNRDRFACGHALWITPAGARSLLLANDACSLPASVGLSHGAGLRVPAFDRTFYVAAGSKGVGRYCTTQCAPNRSTFGGMPSCLDGEATEAVANRKCDDGTPFCGRANKERSYAALIGRTSRATPNPTMRRENGTAPTSCAKAERTSIRDATWAMATFLWTR